MLNNSFARSCSSRPYPERDLHATGPLVRSPATDATPRLCASTPTMPRYARIARGVGTNGESRIGSTRPRQPTDGPSWARRRRPQRSARTRRPLRLTRPSRTARTGRRARGASLRADARRDPGGSAVRSWSNGAPGWQRRVEAGAVLTVERLVVVPAAGALAPEDEGEDEEEDGSDDGADRDAGDVTVGKVGGGVVGKAGGRGGRGRSGGGVCRGGGG